MPGALAICEDAAEQTLSESLQSNHSLLILRNLKWFGQQVDAKAIQSRQGIIYGHIVDD